MFSSVYNYYTQIFATSCLFINMKVLPVSICQAFIDGLDDRLLPGFCTHFLNCSTPKTALPHIKGQSSKKCSKPPYVPRRSTTISGLLPLRLVVLAVKLSQLRSMLVKPRRPSQSIVTIMALTSLVVCLKAHFVATAAADPIHGLSWKTGSM